MWEVSQLTHEENMATNSGVFLWISIELFVVCFALTLAVIRDWRNGKAGLCNFYMAIGAAGMLGALPGIGIYLWEWFYLG